MKIGKFHRHFFSLRSKTKNKNIHRIKWAIFQLKSAWYVCICVCVVCSFFGPLIMGPLHRKVCEKMHHSAASIIIVCRMEVIRKLVHRNNLGTLVRCFYCLNGWSSLDGCSLSIPNTSYIPR